MRSGDPLAVTSHHIVPAANYREADDLAVVSCFFNSENYESKRHSLEAFSESMCRSPLSFFTAEVTFGSTPFVLPESDRNLRIRGCDLMWQKERLLNLVISGIPERFSKIAWLDADILFENPAWAAEASRLLEDYAVVQLFSHYVDLRPGEREHRGDGGRSLSFGAVRKLIPVLGLGDFAHGHSGYAWAARREVLKNVGLYDAAILGSGDDLMAHAFAGEFSSACLHNTFRGNAPFLRHFRRWATSAFRASGGAIGCVDGAALHLWHGEQRHRHYSLRTVELNATGYDPSLHLRADDNGLWAWSDGASLVESCCREYFAARLEDHVDLQPGA